MASLMAVGSDFRLRGVLGGAAEARRGGAERIVVLVTFDVGVNFHQTFQMIPDDLDMIWKLVSDYPALLSDGVKLLSLVLG